MGDVAALTPGDFEAVLESIFQVVDGEGCPLLALSLVRVVSYQERLGYRQPFSIYWTGRQRRSSHSPSATLPIPSWETWRSSWGQ